MKVILLKDVKSQGRKDDIINVSDGYANNYLIKNKLAVAYTETSKKILDKQIQIRNDEEARRRYKEVVLIYSSFWAMEGAYHKSLLFIYL